MNLRQWWNQARRIRDLTIQLNAKGEELYAAHRHIDTIARERNALADKLHLAQLAKAGYLDDLIRCGRTVAHLQGALELSDDDLRRAHARLAVHVAELEKQLEGHPS